MWWTSYKILISFHCSLRFLNNFAATDFLRCFNFIHKFIDCKLWRILKGLRNRSFIPSFSIIIAIQVNNFLEVFFFIILSKAFERKFYTALGSFHKLRLHLGVGRWSEKHIVYYIKSANYSQVPNKRVGWIFYVNFINNRAK